MQANRLQKAIISILILGQVIFWPSSALAFLSGVGALNPVPINDNGSAADNTAFNVIFAPIAADYVPGCVQPEKLFESTDNTAQLGLGFSSIIGGGGALAQALSDEIGSYTAFLDCIEPDVEVVSNLTAPNAYTAALKQQFLTQAKADANAYQAKLKAAQARYQIASQNIWKALMITVLLNTTKTVADQLVNKLVSNYKITNLKAYTDSVATLMYDNQFLRDNFPAAQDQMMARSILTNPALRSQIQPGIYVQASTNLGYQPSSVSWNDPNYYSKMAAVGSGQANPYYLQTAYVAGVDQSQASSYAMANNQIKQGAGYKAPVNCAGSLAQQQSIDQSTKAASAQLANRQALLNQLQQAQAQGVNVSPIDLAKAQQDYQNSLNTWNNLPYTVAGTNSGTGSSSLTANLTSGTNTEGAAAIVMCEAINSPAILVNQGIDSMFKAMGANLSQYNTNNLPGYVSALAGIATQIGSSMILGGITTGNFTLNENQINAAAAQAVTATAGAAINTYNNNSASNLAAGISFNINPTVGSNNSYTFSWSIVPNQLNSASYVVISGPGVPATVTGLSGQQVPNQQPLSGSFPLTVTSYGNYTLTVYDFSGKSLGSATNYISPPASASSNIAGITVPPPPAAPTVPSTSGTQTSFLNQVIQKVAGAFTNSPNLNIRGPEYPTLDIRGQ